MPDSKYRAVKPLTIDSVALCIEVRTALQRLLDEGDAVGAVALADSLLAGTGQESNVKQLRAGIYVDGGAQLGRIDLIQKGANILREFMSHNSAEILYNLGSAELETWQIAARKSELGTAWLEHRCHLHGARDFFNRVAEDENASVELRLRSLTDCGNSYDIASQMSLHRVTCLNFRISGYVCDLPPSYAPVCDNPPALVLRKRATPNRPPSSTTLVTLDPVHGDLRRFSFRSSFCSLSASVPRGSGK